ncbi:MAG: DUF4037 domain-containing protein [Planctomycetota bacterium]|jgi:hypothetical protein|nr:DUF4037 domain-containing protein [Planctomycetota bacterium]
MPDGIIAISRRFFESEVLPILETRFPELAEQSALGFFGYGSECLEMDDDFSRDHHFGIRVNMLVPEGTPSARLEEMLETLSSEVPESFEGIGLRSGHVKGAGVSPEPREAFLTRMLGYPRAPETSQEWLNIPEEDIIHVINGEVWHDPSGHFTQVREVLQGYYPDPVWKRRIAHWCRYFSGMGLYMIKRATLRENWVYAMTSFGRTLKLSMELAFLLNRTYFPYDKWLYPMFRRLPELADEMDPLIARSVEPDCSWDERFENFCKVSDILDEKMVALGIVPSHPKFRGSATSGYRLLEHNYTMITKSLPEDVRSVVPLREQVAFEEFHTAYVADIDVDEWDGLLNLTAEE